MVALSLSGSQSLLSISNLVRFYWIAATLTTANASFSTTSLQSSQSNEVKIDEIACSQVIRSVGFSILDNSKIQHDDVKFLCVVDPNSETSSKLSIQKEGTWLALSNTGPDFEDSWKTAHKQGLNRLIVRGGYVKGSVLELDSHNSSKDSETSSVDGLQSKTSIILASGDTQTITDGVSANEDYVIPVDDGIQHSNSTSTLFKHLHFKKQSIEWKSPLHRHDQKTSNGSSTRNLAINQTGDKTAVVFRVTTTNNGSPTKTANEVSNGVFGTFGDTVTLTSMYSACSYGLLNIAPAEEQLEGLVYSAVGVVDVTVSTTGTTFDIENEIRTQYGSILGNIDHVLFHVPFGTETSIGGGTNWVAYANFPGKYGTYNNDFIIDVQTLLHETGHNIGLAHSGFNGDEYADRSCYMGYTINDGDRNNAQKCFNAAKMDELGWYSNRVTTIRPLFNEEFDGKVIGVADYGTSDSSHTLSLKIANPNKSIDPIFLTYNRAKGINEDTHEGRDQIRIVQGNAGEISWLLASVDPGQTYVSPNYYNGRELQFTFGLGAQDGSVDYVPVTVAQETLPCSTNGDCTSNQSVCNIGTCIDGACVFELQSGCCGNGLCEPSVGEHCSSCALDCELGTNCNEVEGNFGVQVYSAPSAFGIKFNVDVFNDVSFYEIEAVTTTQSGSSVNAKIFTYDGPFESASSDLSQWDEVFDGESSLAESFRVTMTFNMPKLSASGSTRAFYIAYETSAAFYFNGDPGIEVSNSDVLVNLSQITGQLSNNVMPGTNNYGFTTNFLGGIRYTYGDETMIPTFFPSLLPTVDTTNKPSALPSRVASFVPTNTPSAEQSAHPSHEPSNPSTGKPSNAPSENPTNAPVATPSVHPSLKPSDQISMLPSQYPTTSVSTKPSAHPSLKLSDQPSTKPNKNPTAAPSTHPSVYLSLDPSDKPSALTSEYPTISFSTKPSVLPTHEMSDRPSSVPSRSPIFDPSVKPTVHPTVESTDQPSSYPSRKVSISPSAKPSFLLTKPSDQPSKMPSRNPTAKPNAKPSVHPSLEPSHEPSKLPSGRPTAEPSTKPSEHPSLSPSIGPSMMPSRNPTAHPSAKPSVHPSLEPSHEPSKLPSQHPTADPSTKPSVHPSLSPSIRPSMMPSRNPTEYPSAKPSVHPSLEPSTLPSQHPTADPSTKPSVHPSLSPSTRPSMMPSRNPTAHPSAKPSVHPSLEPSMLPSGHPTADPSTKPSVHPSLSPSIRPSMMPSRNPTEYPSAKPSVQPTLEPSKKPSTLPSQHPTTVPSTKPSVHPSLSPSIRPSMMPSRNPTAHPTSSANPSVQPTLEPSNEPSTSNEPTIPPSKHPSQNPMADPSAKPSIILTQNPTRYSSAKPTKDPGQHSTLSPSIIPSTQKSLEPSATPTSRPSTAPSHQPTSKAPTTCIDDPFFNFILDNGNVQNCQWLTRNSDPETTASRIAKYCSRGHVKGACQSTCEYCPCVDDVVFEFRLDNGRLRGCDWLLKNKDPLVDAKRMDNYCYADEGKTIASAVGNACVLSCGFCSGSNVWSSYPSHSPSISIFSPTSAPSHQPTSKAPTTCIDDPLFNFILDNGNVQNCQWLTRNSDPNTTASRIANYCSRGHVKGACQSTCEYCPCVDDVVFEFRLDNGRLRGCDWLLKNKDPSVDATRVDNYCYADEGKTIASAVGNACVLSCGFCSVSF